MLSNMLMSFQRPFLLKYYLVILPWRSSFRHFLFISDSCLLIVLLCCHPVTCAACGDYQQLCQHTLLWHGPLLCESRSRAMMNVGSGWKRLEEISRTEMPKGNEKKSENTAKMHHSTWKTDRSPLKKQCDASVLIAFARCAKVPFKMNDTTMHYAADHALARS